MESARPDATWLAMSVSVITAKISDIAAPARRPAPTPAQVLCVWCATANAAMAPTAMMPSAPRLSTPDFSVMSSPRAVMIRGVPATIVANSMEVTMLSIALSAFLDAQPALQPVLDEHIGSQQEEQQHALEYLGDRIGQAQILLRLLAADVEQRH